MKLLRPIRLFLADSRATGVLLLLCTAVSLLVSNSAWSPAYFGLWEYPLHSPWSSLQLPHDLRLFVNEMLMTIFFFSAGLEIKKELVSGQLNSVSKAIMPVISAAGGMLMPAVLYAACTWGQPGAGGWGIPMATDIAFSLAILSLLGPRIPLSLKIFLTAIAIIDDIGGILTIALFYSGALHMGFLLAALITTAVLAVLGRVRRVPQFIYLLVSMVLWYFVYVSGIHATIAGVIAALFIPVRRIHALEHALRIPVNFVILPLFALANTAIALPADVSSAILSRVHLAVFCGLALGKPLGITLFTAAAVRWKLAALPVGMDMKQVLGIGIVAGIGFTVSLFITSLAFTSPLLQLQARLAIILASFVSGVAGYAYLRVSAARRAAGNTVAEKE